MTQASQILIVEDHPIVEAGLRQLFAPHRRFDIAAVLGRGAVVSAYIRSQPIDLVLLDLELPDVRGIDLLAEIVGARDMTVIVLSGESCGSEIDYALKLGARAVVSKGDSPALILAACDAALAGETYIAPGIAERLDRGDALPIPLSSRQMAILHYVAEGESNKEIGYRMAIAPPTVSFHVAELRRKLGAANNRKLIDRAHQLGLI